MIVAVENHKNYPDHTNGEIRNVGVNESKALLLIIQVPIGQTGKVVNLVSFFENMGDEPPSDNGASIKVCIIIDVSLNV